MTKLKYEIHAEMGKYTDKKTGQEKQRTSKIGIIFEKDDGTFSLKLEMVPLDWKGWAVLLPPREYNKTPQPVTTNSEHEQFVKGYTKEEKKQQGFSEMDDDVPF